MNLARENQDRMHAAALARRFHVGDHVWFWAPGYPEVEMVVLEPPYPVQDGTAYAVRTRNAAIPSITYRLRLDHLYHADELALIREMPAPAWDIQEVPA